MDIIDYEDGGSVNEMLSQFDTDDDKKLSREEFIELLRDVVPKRRTYREYKYFGQWVHDMAIYRNEKVSCWCSICLINWNLAFIVSNIPYCISLMYFQF